MELHDLGRKIFEDFNQAFQALDEIEEVGILFSEQGKTSNACPVHIERNCVGVEHWCVKCLYLHAYYKFLNVTGQAGKFLHPEELNSSTRCVLLFCGDCSTAWNVRKKLFQQTLSSEETNKDDLVLTELNLSKLVLRRHPKSSEAFSHRRWILKQIVGRDFSEAKLWFRFTDFNGILCGTCRGIKSETPTQVSKVVDITDGIWLKVRSEMSMCIDAANRHACNYNAWSHRIWTIHNLVLKPFLSNMAGRKSSESLYWSKVFEFFENELDKVRHWIERHISDHSPMAYIQEIAFILSVLIKIKHQDICQCHQGVCDGSRDTRQMQNDIVQIWVKLMDQSEELLTLYEGCHEALWNYRRGIIATFQKLVHKDLDVGIDSHNSYKPFNTFKVEEEFCNKFIPHKVAGKFSERYLAFIRRHVFVKKSL
ncbi:unnamed protein product [Clavelina lepadiformis]|uniref:Uncharacterized protein n=1 Tax=Clavelina lepadiformis TaxID=159417 RepID=A0ABP0GRJ2_CLALP